MVSGTHSATRERRISRVAEGVKAVGPFPIPRTDPGTRISGNILGDIGEVIGQPTAATRFQIGDGFYFAA